mmetsp:Transcript_47835/g.126620  ORF Transcript_47835/g.126620 Transcript_47835/m.126620 type:complete len:108 (-) Transcript_47835:386-709(-)
MVAISPKKDVNLRGARFLSKERGSKKTRATSTKSKSRRCRSTVSGIRPASALDMKSPMRTVYARHARLLFNTTERSASQAEPTDFCQRSPNELALTVAEHHPSKKKV